MQNPAFLFCPVVENCNDRGQEAFLCRHPIYDFHQESFVPAIIGINSAEGGLMATRKSAVNYYNISFVSNYGGCFFFHFLQPFTTARLYCTVNFPRISTVFGRSFRVIIFTRNPNGWTKSGKLCGKSIIRRDRLTTIRIWIPSK